MLEPLFSLLGYNLLFYGEEEIQAMPWLELDCLATMLEDWLSFFLIVILDIIIRTIIVFFKVVPEVRNVPDLLVGCFEDFFEPIVRHVGLVSFKNFSIKPSFYSQLVFLNELLVKLLFEHNRVVVDHLACAEVGLVGESFHVNAGVYYFLVDVHAAVVQVVGHWNH